MPAHEPFFVLGPTGSGKSSFALALAERTGAEIVNADAFQLYRGMEILTAAPTATDRGRIPHHLYGVLAPTELFDAARFATMARPVLEAIAKRGKIALVVGGSGLYVKSLTHGLSPLPSADPAVRLEIQQLTLDKRIARLRELDPAGAATMNLANPRHVERALELCLLTGRPASLLRTDWSRPEPPDLRGVLLEWPREKLCRRIDARVEAMFAAGAIEEVAALDHLGVLSPTAEKAIGLREIRGFLTGVATRAEAVAAIQQATRRYARRQMTWFRREKWLRSLPMSEQLLRDAAEFSME